MDKPNPVEDLRAKLAALSRAEVRAIASEAGLSGSTVEKFRLGHIKEPRLSKLDALRTALRKHQKRAASTKPGAN